MCIIIHKPQAGVLNTDITSTAEYLNQDGFGIVYLDTLTVHRTMDYKKAREWVASERPFVAHYRYATKGKVNRASCHPYPFTGGLLVSNGTVESLGDKDVCDTEVIAKYLGTVPVDYWPQLLSMTPTRFCIVHKSGEVDRHGNWFERDGVYYSKDSCFPRPAPARWSGGRVPATAWGKGKGYGNVNTKGFIGDPDPLWDDKFYNDRDARYDTYNHHDNALERDTYDASTHGMPDYGGCDTHPDNVWAEESEVEDMDNVDDDGSVVDEIDVADYEMDEDAGDGWHGMHLLAVYGTLKQGRSNHRLFHEGLAATTLIDPDAMTVERLRMVNEGIPFVYNGEHRDGKHIEVEVYHVASPTVRARIDRLEGHPNWYERKLTEIELFINGEIVYAWMYFMPGEPAPKSKFIASF